MNKKKKIFTRVDIIGYAFVSPFIIGFIFFFLKPLIQSTIYSFNKIMITPEGFEMEAVGFEHYRKAILGDGPFVRAILSTYGSILIKVVFVMFFSIFMGILLSQKFKGRLFFRTIAFMPFIFSSPVAMRYQSTFALGDTVSEKDIVLVSKDGINFMMELMASFGFDAGIVDVFSKYINEIFEVTWSSSIPIVLFVVGLKSIPQYIYEVCEIEGATKWETFWKITFPLLSPTILLCLVYTLIIEFNSGNEIVNKINGNAMLRVDYACAQTWVYSIIIFITFAVVYKVVSKRTIYLD